MKNALKVLLIADALFILAGGMLGPIYAIFVERIGGDILDASWAWAVFSITSGILMYLMGNWEDHAKHKEKLIVFGYAFTALGFLGYYFIRTSTHLFLVQIIFGISGAILRPAYDGLYSELMDKGKYSSEWGLWEAMYSIVTGIAAIIGGYIVFFWGFTNLFFIMFGISIIGTISSIYLLIAEWLRKRK